jgi:hypothetical protein
MKKVLEDYLWSEISYVNDEKRNSQFHRSPRDVIQEMLHRKWIESPKQAYVTLNKWIGKGIYEYGSSLDLGWKCKKREF